MFMDVQIFKKMLKGAYDGIGLSVARQRDKYIFAGNYWCMKVRRDCIQKKAKAAAIEIIGEFPEDGENFVIRKKEEKRSDEFNMRWAEKIYEFGKVDEKPLFRKTAILQQYGSSMYRYWQSEEKDIVLVPEIITGLIEGQIIKDRETELEGPYKIENWDYFKGMMYWRNNAGELYVETIGKYEKDTQEDEVLQKMKEIVLPGPVPM